MNFFEIIDSDLDKIKNQIVAVIGGGGKSSLIYRIGTELVERDFKVILTSTTKIQSMPGIELIIQNETKDFMTSVSEILEKNKIVTLAKEKYKGEKLSGLDPETITTLRPLTDVILIEADGSRQRSLKTHKEYEPVIPPDTNTVIIICGANIVGAPLNDENVHRAELFAQKWRLSFNDLLDPEIIASELLSPDSYLRNVPPHSNVVLYINKSDLNSEGALKLVDILKQKCDYRLFSGSLLNNSLKRH